MERNFYVVVSALIIALFLYGSFNVIKVKSLILCLTKGSGEVYELDEYGRLDGEGLIYKNGIVVFRGNYEDGKVNGWGIQYYDNGKIKNRTFYKNDLKDGKEFGYYENGKLNYTGNWSKGKDIGNGFHYLENERMDIYNAIDNGNLFYYSEYSLKKVNKAVGTVFSYDVYSKTEKGTKIILKDGNNYSGINDLYLTTALPPYVRTSIQVKVGKRELTFSNVKSNNLKVSNAFSQQGEYNILVVGKVSQDNRIIKIDTLSFKIQKN